MPQRHPDSLRRTPRRRLVRARSIVLRSSLAVGLTAPVLVAGVAASPEGTDSTDDTARSVLDAASAPALDGSALFDASELAARAERVSRSAVRVRRPVTLQPRAVDQVWATAPLNVWAGPDERTERLGLIKEGTKLATTGQRLRGFAEVLVGEQRRDRWVNARYLATEKPQPKRTLSTSSSSAAGGSTATSGLSTGACPDGSSIEAGLTPAAVRVYRAVCNAFPALTTYGGLDPHGEHVDGRAIDFMITDATLGNQVAEYLLANASTLQLRDIIWYQKIWTPDRASEGWRYMGDRGSATANHIDHVHVAVY